MTRYLKSLLVLFFLCATPMLCAEAQTSPDATGAPVAQSPQPVAIALTPEEKLASFEGSFFFNADEISSIQRAKQQSPSDLGGNTVEKAPEDDVLQQVIQMIPPNRVINLSGVYYRSSKDWTVWMNGKKVTPKNLLPEIVDIKVDSSSHVRLRWYDNGLNKVIPVTLMPHQTYNITTGVTRSGADNN